MARPSAKVTVDIDPKALAEGMAKMLEPQLKDVAGEIAEEARATSAFADKTGNLRKSIKVRKSKFENGGYIVLSTAPHAHLIEFGHDMVTRKGRKVGEVPPYPFLRPAANKVFARLARFFRSLPK